MESRNELQKNKWQNQRISRHFNNRKKKQYDYWDRRWSRKHTNSAKTYNGPGPNGCNCCQLHSNRFAIGPSTDSKRRNLSMDPQLTALNKKYSFQYCLKYQKIKTKDSNIESEINKLNEINELSNPHQLQTDYAPVTLNDFLPKELQSDIASNTYKQSTTTNYSSNKTVVNIDKIMVSLNNNEYGIISKRLRNLIMSYPIMQTLLPHIKKIRKFAIATKFANKNYDIVVDSLVTKRFVSKLNGQQFGKYSILCTSNVEAWTQNVTDSNSDHVIKTKPCNNGILNVLGIKSLVFGYCRRNCNPSAISIDVIDLCLAYCDVMNLAALLLPYNFHVKNIQQKTDLTVKCHKTSHFGWKGCQQMFICLVFANKKMSGMESNWFSFMNIVPILSLSRVNNHAVPPYEYWRRGPPPFGSHNYTWRIKDSNQPRVRGIFKG